MKLKSFGCSFTYGSDLIDCDFPELGASQQTWPALLAKNFKLPYECYARPGIGNLRIMNSVLDQCSLRDPSIFVVNWTWTDRFDFLAPENEYWTTLRPDGDTPHHKLYYKYFYNQYHTMLTNASYIKTTIDVLQSQNIQFVMTLMDSTLFDEIDPTWQDPRPISFLQKQIKSHIVYFDNDTFLNWSRKKGFAISQTLHPLEDAHQAAFELIKSYNLV